MLSRRLLRCCAIGALAVAMGTAGSPVALADNLSHHGRPKPWPACPHGRARASYPPRACKVETDRTDVRPGGRFSVFGLGFRPGERVVIAMPPVGRLATVRANADGAVLTSAALPQNAPPGTDTLTMTAASGNRVVGTIRVVPADPMASRADARSLPFSGPAAAIPLAAAGAMMLASGAVVIAMVRRRRRFLVDG